MLLSLAILLTLGGSLGLYLASPNQNWLRNALPVPTGTGLGAAQLALAGWLWTQLFSAVAGLFTLLILTMLSLTLFPYLSLLKAAPGAHDERS